MRLLPIALGMLIYQFLTLYSFPKNQCYVAAIASACGLWWALESLPLPVTSLIPCAGFPLLGIQNGSQLASAYGHPIVMLLMGGFIISKSLEQSGVHRRLAIYMLRLFGNYGSKGIIWGFMLASSSLSMWMSNTATTLMLVPVALAIIEQYDDERFSAPLFLGIAYSASVGGFATPIGTPPNLVYMHVYQSTVGSDLSFLSWIKCSLPIVLIFLPVMAILLTRSVPRSITFELPSMAPWSSAEKRVLIIFAITTCLWISRKEPFGGWSGLLNMPQANDASVVMLAVISLFLIPDAKGKPLLEWEHASKIPWGLLLLFGGGIAIANAFKSSGLSLVVGQQLATLASYHILTQILIICLLVTFLTEFTSNTATSNLILPILATTAIAAKLPPEAFMFPATLSSSCAFMLPVATAPNTIVYSTKKIPLDRMIKEGFILNIVGSILIGIWCYLVLS